MVGITGVIKDSTNAARWCEFPFAELLASGRAVGAVDVFLGDFADVGYFVWTDTHDLKDISI